MTDTAAIKAQAVECLQKGLQQLEQTIQVVEARFNEFAAGIDFPTFCLIYSIVLIWVLIRINRREMFRPKNWELIDWKTRMKMRAKAFLFSLPFVKQYTQKKFKKEMESLEMTVKKEFEKGRDPLKSKTLPVEGMKKENLEARIRKWAKEGDIKMFCGKLSGMMYAEGSDFCRETSEFAAKYMYHNPLHLNAFKELTKMETEILKMTSNMVSDNRLYGMITSGGSESLVMTMKVYKETYKRDRPNVVVPVSIHAAIDKGGNYFNIEVRKARLTENFQADVGHMESMIDSNTIALYASYPSFPYGIIDPISDIAKLAVKHKIGFHLDGCLGGMLAVFLKEHENKFSADIEGVTSISLDHHKYGLAPKGAATVFFKTRELRHKMYFVYSEWCGGLFVTPSFAGSRSGFASAGAWYALTHVGRKQYTQNAIDISETTKKVAEEMRAIPGVKVFGNPQLCVIAFDTTEVNVYDVNDYLGKEKGWHLSPLHLPRGCHIGLTPANCENVRDNLVGEIREAINFLKQRPGKSGDSAALYGATAKIPSAEMGEDMMRTFVAAVFK